MIKTSSLSHFEVVQRLHEIKTKAETMYYWAQEQDFDTWLAYCDMISVIDKFISNVDDFADTILDQEGRAANNDR